MKRAILIALYSLAFPVLASPTISGISAKPSFATAGEPVRITIGATDAENGICAFAVNWGDGKSSPTTKVGKPNKTFPFTFQHTYAEAGTYKISAYGKRSDTKLHLDTHLACLGGASYTLKVESAADAAARAQSCPPDWAITHKARDGAFTCTPKVKGAAKPAAAITCPAGTSYFVNNKSLGCEKTR